MPKLAYLLPCQNTFQAHLFHISFIFGYPYQGTNEGDMKQGQRKDNIEGRKQEERSTEYISLHW